MSGNGKGGLQPGAQGGYIAAKFGLQHWQKPLRISVFDGAFRIYDMISHEDYFDGYRTHFLHHQAGCNQA